MSYQDPCNFHYLAVKLRKDSRLRVTAKPWTVNNATHFTFVVHRIGSVDQVAGADDLAPCCRDCCMCATKRQGDIKGSMRLILSRCSNEETYNTIRERFRSKEVEEWLKSKQ